LLVDETILKFERKEIFNQAPQINTEESGYNVTGPGFMDGEDS
jgi:hypothetical protein